MLVTEATRIFDRVQRGDARAAEELLPLVDEELRKLAPHKTASEASGHTLQATAPIHQASSFPGVSCYEADPGNFQAPPHLRQVLVVMVGTVAAGVPEPTGGTVASDMSPMSPDLWSTSRRMLRPGAVPRTGPATLGGLVAATVPLLGLHRVDRPADHLELLQFHGADADAQRMNCILPYVLRVLCVDSQPPIPR